MDEPRSAERGGRGGRRPEVAVALDFPTPDEAMGMVDRLGAGVDLFKVGLELFTRTGPGFVRELEGRGKRIFLDLKLHDIPNTVAGAVRAAADLDVDLLTVHAWGGSAMIRAARDAAEGTPTRVLAVTVLTSMGRRELHAVQGADGEDPAEVVARLADLALDAGAHGVVASPAEARLLRSGIGPDPLLVIPGIRLPGDDPHDQTRVAGPGDAVRDGADILVVGRSVTRAPDPGAALEQVRTLMEAEGPGEGVLAGGSAAGAGTRRGEA